MDGASGLRLRVLGAVDATRDGEPVDLGGRRQRAVVAALVVAGGEIVSPDRLVDCVWGASPPASATSALQSYISHLRRRLEPDAGARSREGVIARSGGGYRLCLGTDAVDAWSFEDAVQSAVRAPSREAERLLEAALRLWRGPAYADYATEPWIQPELTRLTELRSVARERLLEARLELGGAALLVPELEALVAEEPLREERWRLLALALYRSHRQADALAALRRARDVLAGELGVDPGPALRSLEAEILVQSPLLDGPTGAPPPAPERTGPAPRPVPATARGSGLQERERELEVLERAVDQLRSGRAGVVLIDGPAGIGKSRLLAEAGELAAAADVAVLSARGSHLERAFGFGAVRQLFEPELLDPARRASLLDGPAAGAAAVFEAAPAAARVEGAFAALHGLYWLTVNLSGVRPLLLAVDDVQWCDRASLRFLAYLVKRLDGLRVLVVVTLRTGEAHADAALLDELATEPMTVVVRPRSLSEAAARTLVTERLGPADDAFVAICHRMTSGNPLLLRQLLRALESEGVPPDVTHVDTVRAVGSRAVSSLVMLRLRRMAPDAIAAARAVAVLGAGAALPTIAALTRSTDERAAAALDLLSRGEVLRDGERPSFVHPLVRDAVYEDLPVAERALWHERAAHILRRDGADAEQIAAHLLHAPLRRDPAAVAILRSAARNAADRGAADSAILSLRRALAEVDEGPERVDVLIELGTLETHLDGPSAIAHLCDAYERTDDPVTRARLATLIARTHAFASPAGVATEFARAAAAALPPSMDDARQGLVALQRVTGHMHALPPAAYLDGPAPQVSGTGDGARMLAATLAHERLLAGEDRAGAVELARFALDGDRLFRIDNGLSWIVAAYVLVLADAELGDLWERALAHARTTGSLFSVMSVNLWRGFSLWRRGDLTAALESLTDARDQHRMWGGGDVGEAYTAAFTAGVHLDRGDLDAADRVLHRERELPTRGAGWRHLQEARVRLRLAQGRPADARRELAAIVAPPGVANPVSAPWRGLAAATAAAEDRLDDALRLADEELALARRWGAPSVVGRALRLRGELDPVGGTPFLRDAVATLSSTPAALESARARLALGRDPRVDDDEAVALLRRSLTDAEACGAAALAEAAAGALAARGDQAPHHQIGQQPEEDATEPTLVVIEPLTYTPGGVP